MDEIPENFEKELRKVAAIQKITSILAGTEGPLEGAIFVFKTKVGEDGHLRVGYIPVGIDRALVGLLAEVHQALSHETNRFLSSNIGED